MFSKPILNEVGRSQIERSLLLIPFMDRIVFSRKGTLKSLSMRTYLEE